MSSFDMCDYCAQLPSVGEYVNRFKHYGPTTIHAVRVLRSLDLGILLLRQSFAEGIEGLD